LRSLKTHIAINVPYDLARYLVSQRKLVRKYETNQEIRALDTWLVLKHETSSGHIQNWNKQKAWLCRICKVSETILRHRLKVLADMQLIEYDRHVIRVCSWQIFAERLEIDISNYLTVNYCIDDKQRVHEWIIATEIEDNKQRQEFVLIAKLNKNPECKRALEDACIRAGADKAKLQNIDYLLSWLRVCYLNDFMQGSDIHDLIIEFRPDNNRSVKGMQRAWNTKCKTTVSYWKKIMKKHRVIDWASLQVESKERMRNKYCEVLWLPEAKQTLLCMCDQIDLLKPWLIDNPLMNAA